MLVCPLSIAELWWWKAGETKPELVECGASIRFVGVSGRTKPSETTLEVHFDFVGAERSVCKYTVDSSHRLGQPKLHRCKRNTVQKSELCNDCTDSSHGHLLKKCKKKDVDHSRRHDGQYLPNATTIWPQKHHHAAVPEEGES